MILPEGWTIVHRIENFDNPREKPWMWWNEGEYGMSIEEYDNYLWIGLGPDNEARANDHTNYGPAQHGTVDQMGIAILVDVSTKLAGPSWLIQHLTEIAAVANQLRGPYMSPDQKRIVDTIEAMEDQ